MPIGAVVFAVLLVFLKVPSPNTPVVAGLKAIDWTGSLLIVGSALMVLLGLEFGGVSFPWSSAAIICLIVFGFLIFGLFLVNGWKLAANPVIPLRLFTNRSSLAARDTAAVIATMSFLRSISTAIIIVFGGIVFQDQIQAANDGLAAGIGHEAAVQFDGGNAVANVDMISNLPSDKTWCEKSISVRLEACGSWYVPL